MFLDEKENSAMPSVRRLLAIGCALLAVLLAPAARGQAVTLPGTGRGAPTAQYFSGFNPFYEGEYRDALQVFRGEVRGAIKSVESRWIDSICYHTMSGECCYQMGQNAEAIRHYDSALQLYVAFADWMLKVQFEPRIRPAAPLDRVQVPWGTSKRRSVLGDYASTNLIAQGRLNNNDQVQRGGVVSAPILFPINVQEIVRTATIALRRRREILGPVAAQSQITKDVLAALSRPQTPPNHWSEVLQDVQLGMANAAAGKDEQAKGILERALIAEGQYDHPLTGQVLLELGRIAFDQGQFPQAADYFLEATYSAAQYHDPSVIEEAFRYGFLVHVMTNQPGVYAPLESAAAWARVKGYRALQSSLTTSAAENQACLGNYNDALKLVGTARSIVGNRDMATSRLGARLNYVTALAQFGRGDSNAGMQSLATATSFQQSGGSNWLYQISLVDEMFSKGAVSSRALMALYQVLLREPTQRDWSYDPLEALSVVTTPHEPSLENWFDVAIDRREDRAAFEIAELARRHRFLSTLPLGGRLLELRWLLDGPLEALDRTNQLERQDLLARFPRYADLSRETTELRAQERAEPLFAVDTDAIRRKSERQNRLAALAGEQTRLLETMAVGRHASAIIFPPRRTVEAVQAAMPPKQGVLAFFGTKRKLHGLFITKDEYMMWPVGTPAQVQKRAVSVLRELGHVDGNRKLDAAALAADGWRKPARELLAGLLEGGKSDFAAGLEELAIVPDGLLWYVPFEALPSSDAENSPPLISRIRIRYAPTAGLAVPDGRGRRQLQHTAVVLGRLFPRDADTVATEAFEELSQIVPGCVALPVSSPAAGNATAQALDGVIVFQDLANLASGPYDWSPMPLSSGSRGNTLADWLTLGAAGPQVVMLPGYHTPAENALKGVGQNSNGDDIFLPVCGLMASGARTILISRWRTAGQSSYDLVREFTRELPHASAASAWQRSVEFVTSAELNPAAEPRVEAKADAPLPTAEHPFFWAGYLLVDSSDAALSEDEEDPAAEVLVQ